MRNFLSEAQVRDALPHLEKTADLLDQLIDLTLNHRQSGHPGGSRSKVHLFTTLLMSGAMRVDLRNPGAAFGDRFVLGAGHCTPLLYSVLALMNECLDAAYERTGDDRFRLGDDPHRVLRIEDLLDFRRNGGLPGHAEMEGKTLFVKANTGPSGHGVPAAAGEAMALVHAGCKDVAVYCMEGEGGLTAGAVHETRNSAYGLGLENYTLLLDWNDHGIDPTPNSRVVHGDPRRWFEAAGWRVAGTEDATDFPSLFEALREIVAVPEKNGHPGLVFARNVKGRGYGKDVEGYKSHGAAHKPNSAEFWATKAPFQEKYGVRFEGFGEARPGSDEAFRAQTQANFDVLKDLLRRDEALVDFVAGRLAESAAAVPVEHESLWWDRDRDPMEDPRITDLSKLPEEIYAKPGDEQPNRKGLAAWGAHVNAVAREVAGRPLFLVCAADLAESTNIAGFAKGALGQDGFGWYDRIESPRGALLPQQITEFANAAITSHLASVNFARNPEERFVGYFGGCATYGSFSYLKYGPMRLFSQLAQDSQLKVGKVLWVAGHSGPETAEDSRTHFGIYSPSVTDLFPKGYVVDLHPYDFNETIVLLTAAMGHDVPIVALHLTRPGVEIQDRAALGAGDFREAAKGAYLLKEFDDAKGPRRGTVIFRGTSPVKAAFELLKDHADELPNVRFLAAPSRFLFDHQPREYRDAVLPWSEWQNSMVVTNNGRRTLGDWYANKVCEEYTLSPDHDDRWRTGGSVDEILDEAHLTWPHVLEAIRRFADDCEVRMERVRG